MGPVRSWRNGQVEESVYSLRSKSVLCVWLVDELGWRARKSSPFAALLRSAGVIIPARR